MASVIKLCCRFLRDKFRAGLHFGCLRVPVEEHCLPCSYSPLCFTSLWDRLGGRGTGGRMGHPHWCSWLPRWGGVSPWPQLLSSSRAPCFLQRDCDAAVFQLHTPGVAGELLPPLLKLAVRLLIFFFFLFLMLFGGCCFLLPNIS